MHELIREVRALAQTGLHYTRDPFDRERFERLITIANRMVAAFGDADEKAVERFFVPEKGYATPKVDLRACVVRDGEVLLVKEKSDGRWTLPGGWADQNEAPSAGVVREVKEEAGLDIAVKSLYAVKDRDRHPYEPKYPVSIYKLFFTASVVGGEPRPDMEIAEVGFFAPDALPPLSLARVLPEDITAGYAHYTAGSRGTTCD